MKSRWISALACLLIIGPLLFGGAVSAGSRGEPANPADGATVAQATPATTPTQGGNQTQTQGNVVPYAERQAAAARAKAEGMVPGGAGAGVLDPTATPHYFGPYANYANSQLPQVVTTTPSPVWYFAEGTTRPNFQSYICIQNPGAIDASVLQDFKR